MPLASELFFEAFKYLTRLESESLRVTCRAFNGFASELRDVHDYRLRLSYFSLAEADGGRISMRIRAIDGRQLTVEDEEETAFQQMILATRESIIRNFELYGHALTQRLCQVLMDASRTIVIWNFYFINRMLTDQMRSVAAPRHLYVYNMSSAQLMVVHEIFQQHFRFLLPKPAMLKCYRTSSSRSESSAGCTWKAGSATETSPLISFFGANRMGRRRFA